MHLHDVLGWPGPMTDEQYHAWMEWLTEENHAADAAINGKNFTRFADLIVSNQPRLSLAEQRAAKHGPYVKDGKIHGDGSRS